MLSISAVIYNIFDILHMNCVKLGPFGKYSLKPAMLNLLQIISQPPIESVNN